MDSSDAIVMLKRLAHKCAIRACAQKNEISKHLFKAAALLRDAAKELKEASDLAGEAKPAGSSQDEPSDEMKRRFAEVLDHIS